MSYEPRETIGLEMRYNKAGFITNAVPYLAKGGEDFEKGQLVKLKDGLLEPMAHTDSPDEDEPIVGVCAHTEESVDDGTWIAVYDSPYSVYECTFENHEDIKEDVDGNTANLKQITLPLSSATNDDSLKGAILYIYAGPGKGDIRTVTGNTDADPTVVTVNENFSQAPTGDSKVILVADHDGNNDFDISKVGSLNGMTDNGKIDVDQKDFKDGYLNVLRINPDRLTMNVMISLTKTLHGMGQTDNS